jgi:hypothetical protein
MGFYHARFQATRYNDFGHAAEKGEGPHVTLQPILRLLDPSRFRKSVITGTQHGHKDLGLKALTAVAIDDRDGLASIVYK